MEYDLRKFQLTLLIIAKEIKRICDTNSIKYSLADGSLLGGVRHKGFIPWDDDMDFMMRREEYDKFRACCLSQLGEDFMLIDWNNNKYYGHGFLKIMLKGTVAVEHGKTNDKYPHYIYVDVFPFDYVGPDPFDRFKQKWISYFSIRLLQEKSGSKRYKYIQWPKKVLYIFYYGLQHLFSRKFLIRLCEKQMKKFNAIESKELTSIAGYYGYNKMMIPESYFDKYVMLDFEDTQFMAISEYDKYLKQIYGNYMELPPIEKRRNHGMEKVDFGKFAGDGGVE